MNKPSVFFAAALLVYSLVLNGCTFSTDSLFENNIVTKSLADAFCKPGPTRQLVMWDEKLMQPALVMADQLRSKNYVLANSERVSKLQQIKQWQVELSQEKPLLMTDAYLYFGKRFLKNLQLKLEDKITDQVLVDSRMAFENYRSKALYGKELYAFTNFNSNMLYKGMSYEALRKLLRMPGFYIDHSSSEVNRDKVRETFLWIHQGEFLCVEFEKTKAIQWQYSKNIPSFKVEKKAINYNAISWTLKNLSKQPTVYKMNSWLKQEGYLLAKVDIRDQANNKKKVLKKYLWVFDDGYLYAEFLDNKINFWQYQGINNGFWN